MSSSTHIRTLDPVVGYLLPNDVGEPGKGAGAHAVKFYDNDAALVATVAGYVATGLQGGDAVLVVAERSRLDAFSEALLVRGVAVAQVVARGMLVLIDADEVIGEYMNDEAVDDQRFRKAVVRAIQRTRGGSASGRVRVYGEMVDMLWQRGNGDAVLRVEELWNEIVASQRVPLLCAYASSALASQEHRDMLTQICERHSHVAVDDEQQMPWSELHNHLVPTQPAASAALERERTIRRELEGEAGLLFRLAEAVNRADTLEQVYEPALDAVLALLRADRASILLFDSDGVMRFKASRGLSAKYRDAVEGHSPWSPDVTEAAPILVDDVEVDEAWASYLTLFRDEGIRALGFVPLLYQRRLLGKFMIYGNDPRAFSQRQVELAQTIAAQIAQAVGRAQLFEAERRARAESEKHARRAEENAERTRRLQRLTARLGAAVSADEVATIIIDAGAEAVGAATAAVWLVDGPKRRLELVKARGYSEEALPHVRTMTLEPGIPTADAVLEAEPVWLESRQEYVKRYPASEARTRALKDPRSNAPLSIACLPLGLESHVFGVATFVFDRTRAWAAEEREFLVAASQQCAQALERARLFEAERKARLAREEVLAIVSHDLRNPLNAIAMSAALLSSVDVGDKSARIRQGTEKIQRSVNRMARLIEDLVDFASIETGHLTIEPAPTTAGDIVAAALDMFDVVARERDIRLEAQIGLDEPRLICDHHRTVQALANLVANAVKVSPSGGLVTVGVERRAAEMVFSVDDRGPGISAEDCARLFERYWRGKQVDYTGTGLGLAIAKGIVEAQAGRIWCESTTGEGSRFSFALPAASAS